ncbi:MAG: ureidoglycolate lyase, partial [Zoogloea sp.]
MGSVMLTPEALSAEAFAPFGQVIEASDAVRH